LRWDIYTTANSQLPVNDVSAISTDHEGNIWLSTWGGGVVKISPSNHWTIYNSSTGITIGDIIKALAVDIRGWIWINTNMGTAYFNGTVWQQLQPTETGLPGNDMDSISTDSLGNIWFTTAQNSIAVYNPDGLAPDLTQITDVTQHPESILLLLNNRYLIPDTNPLLENGRTLVPMRFIFEALGAEINWIEGLQQVEATIGNNQVKLTINDSNAYANGQLITLDVPPKLVNNRTLVPLRFISESLGLQVDWDPVIRAVILTGAGDSHGK
ncbi:MAG: stalk domain-containing protein, partial [Bacillota bacterium]|nr:stalk domain-containing protein [Bacillota bacterium]